MLRRWFFYNCYPWGAFFAPCQRFGCRVAPARVGPLLRPVARVWSAGAVSHASRVPRPPIRPVDPRDATRAAFDILNRHVPEGQIRKVREALPEEVLALQRKTSVIWIHPQTVLGLLRAVQELVELARKGVPVPVISLKLSIASIYAKLSELGLTAPSGA